MLVLTQIIDNYVFSLLYESFRGGNLFGRCYLVYVQILESVFQCISLKIYGFDEQAYIFDEQIMCFSSQASSQAKNPANREYIYIYMNIMYTI